MAKHPKLDYKTWYQRVMEALINYPSTSKEAETKQKEG